MSNKGRDSESVLSLTKEQNAHRFMLYLGTFKLVVWGTYIVAFLTLLTSLAFGALPFTSISVWCMFGLFLIDQYSSHLLMINKHEVLGYLHIFKNRTD